MASKRKSHPIKIASDDFLYSVPDAQELERNRDYLASLNPGSLNGVFENLEEKIVVKRMEMMKKEEEIADHQGKSSERYLKKKKNFNLEFIVQLLNPITEVKKGIESLSQTKSLRQILKSFTKMYIINIV